MQLWLKYEATTYGRYTIQQVNQLPTAAQGVALVSAIILSSLCMIYPVWAMLTIIQAVTLFGMICLLVWNIPYDLKCKFKSKPVYLTPWQNSTTSASYIRYNFQAESISNSFFFQFSPSSFSASRAQ
jgi:hypothetical protein